MALLRGLKSGLERTALEGLQVPGDTGPTAYTGTLPANIGELSGWTGTSCWTVLHNFKDATLGPLACPAASDSGALSLILIPGGDTSATKTATGQSNYASQTGLNSSTSQAFLFAYASALWKHNATIPTAYIVTMRFDATPSAGDTFYSGIDGGSNSGFWLEAHPTSGVRAAIGVGSGYTYTSYVAGASLYDGEYHTLMLVIDDAAGKAKLFSEFGNTESTGLSIAAGGNTICTIGPLARGYAFNGATYLLSARGEHPLLYTNAQLAFDAYEDARLNGTHPAAITSLPTTLAEINAATGLTFETLYNFGGTTVTPAAGSSGGSLAADTGVIHSATNGTVPTAGTAPKIKTSFTSQGSTVFDSPWDNLVGTACMPDGTTPMFAVIVYKMGSNGNIKQLLGRTSGPASSRGWYIDSTAGDTLRLVIANAGGGASSVALAGTVGGDIGLWHALFVSLPGNNGGAGGTLSALVDNTSEVTATGIIHATPAAMGGYIGAMAGNYTDATPNCYGNPELALVAWADGSQPNSTARAAAHNAFRWRYGL